MRVGRWVGTAVLATLTVVWLAGGAGVARAQEMAGTWQGTLETGGKGLRTVLKIEQGEGGKLKGMLYSIDQGPDGLPLTTITVTDGLVKFTLDQVHGSYEGKASADGKAVTGKWTQGQTWPLNLVRATEGTEWAIDASPHAVRFVEVEKDVRLEVLDWGGTGRAVIFLAGLGSTAHDFDEFAPKLTPQYHVYAITRRGYGASSKPAPTCDNYSVGRLGADVLAVMDAEKIERPVLAGHSIAGEELSWVGTEHPERVAGLVYLDAGYPYAYFDEGATQGDELVDAAEVRKELRALTGPGSVTEQRAKLERLTGTSLPRLERDLAAMRTNLATAKEDEPGMPDTAETRIGRAILNGVDVFSGVKAPVLAIYAYPHKVPPTPPGMEEATFKARFAEHEKSAAEQASAFEKGNPGARVVRIANADHYVHHSNEAEVLQEMRGFLERQGVRERGNQGRRN